MTGADSPVMALSSTDATPSMTSPSTGMMSPVSTSTTSPLRKVLGLDADRWRDWPVTHRVNCFAITVWRMPRNAEACARLRPSASASAKLANSTVKASHTCDGEDEAGGCLAMTSQRLHEQQGGDQRADVNDEHHRIAPLHARIQLAERIEQRGTQQLLIQERQLLS